MKRSALPYEPAAASSHARPAATNVYEQIYDCVRQVPRGYVTTYGMVGKLAGTHARVVGYALHYLGNVQQPDVPWQRVINARGRISTHGDEQRWLLEQEGILFDDDGRVDLQQYGWP